MDRKDDSTFGRMQKKYWTTKHALVYKKLGIKQEDQCIIASDSDLDLKLELFHAIQSSCDDLLRIIENYQDRICSLAHEENAMGRFLKEQSKIDKTRAGKMMSAVGKTMSYTAQQRLSLRVPLVRLYQEVETFRNRAVVDCALTVNKMEASRTNYRGALLWMKDVSQELDPDTYKRLEKFRKVQAQVKQSKCRFDKLKLDSCQKIDLLSASRCNMFSRILATYENTLVQFWEKTAKTLTHVSECFKGYQHYEFSMLKELTEPSKKLAEETSLNVEADEDNLINPGDENDKDQSLFFDGEYHDEEIVNKEKVNNELPVLSERSDSLVNLMDASMKLSQDNLIDVPNQANLTVSSDNEKKISSKNPTFENFSCDLLTNNPEIDDSSKDDLTLLNEILDIPTSSNSEQLVPESVSTFSDQWLSKFNSTNLTDSGSDSMKDVESNVDLTNAMETKKEFLPSRLLDMDSDFSNDQFLDFDIPSNCQLDSNALTSNKPNDVKQMDGPMKSKPKKNMSAWYGLFADLDPLANPDAVGQDESVKMNEQRNC